MACSVLNLGNFKRTNHVTSYSSGKSDCPDAVPIFCFDAGGGAYLFMPRKV